jgi:hypothetical protein
MLPAAAGGRQPQTSATVGVVHGNWWQGQDLSQRIDYSEDVTNRMD